MNRTRIPRITPPPTVEWWKLALQANEIAWAAPMVIAHRTARMVLAGGSPSARDRREFTRMTSEKAEAWMESVGACALQVATLQRAMLASAQAQWWNPWAAGQHLHSALPRIAARGLEPIRRRASANARRLARTALGAR